MTREEAINMLYGIRADNLNLDDVYTKDKYDALTMAIKALEQTRWIPVSESLPETDDDVLVCDGVDMFVAWYSWKGMWQGWNSHDNSFERDTPIIAWMPLPKPYSEVEQ